MNLPRGLLGLVGAVALLGACESGAAPPAAEAPPGRAPSAAVVRPDFAAVAEQLRPSVVQVVTTFRQDGGSGTRVVRGIGSGVVVSRRGHVLTNEHVVASASTVDVGLSDLSVVPARVLYRDPSVDLALLQLDTPPSDLQPVRMRERAPVPGEWVMAIGQPYGLGNTLTVGVVSALDRDYADLGWPAGLRADGAWSFIQTDASVNIGNSGGPLTDARGEVVGITTAVRSDGQGLAFAIPAPMAERFLDELWTHGRFRRPRLGLRADNATREEVPGRAGAVKITGVVADGPAARAGLADGDFLLTAGGKPLTRVSQLAYRAQLSGVGEPLEVQVLRGDDTLTLALVPEELR